MTAESHRRASISRRANPPLSAPAACPSPASGSSSSASARRPSLMNGKRESDADEGIVMREKDRDDVVLQGKGGGREVGVTRPKRRLSRALSATSSPPVSPSVAGQPSFAYEQLSHQARNIAASVPYNSYAPAAQSTAAHMPSRDTLVARLDDKPPLSPYQPTAGPAAKESTSPKLWGIELKWISLVTLALQNAFLTIIMHYSRISTAPNKTYSAAAAVLLNELLKGGVSTVMALKNIDHNMSSQPAAWREKELKLDNRKLGPVKSPLSLFHPTRLRVLARSVFSGDCYKLAVPAILYVVQNNLQYVAASNLDVATFQVTYQMKILTTAFFSVLMLGRRLSRAKWAALFMLALGVGIVQLQTSGAGHAAAPPPAPSPTLAGHDHGLRSEIPEIPDTTLPSGGDAPDVLLPVRVMHPLRGFLAVTLACLTSGLAGVYFELILKSGGGSGPAPDLWIRNTQLSLFSLVPAIMPILFSDHPADVTWWASVTSKFAHFNGWAIGTVLTQTFGGLITAIVIRYSDNIMKGFATSLSIIISFLASVALFNYHVTLAFAVGAAIVLGATYLYNSPSVPDVAPTRTSIAVAPGSPIPTSAPILGEPQPPSRTSSVINLLGLGSKPSSRRPSATDLLGAGAAQFPLSSPALSRSGSYSSQHGFTNSTHGSHTQLHEFGRTSPQRTPPPHGKPKPLLTVNTSPQ